MKKIILLCFLSVSAFAQFPGIPSGGGGGFPSGGGRPTLGGGSSSRSPRADGKILNDSVQNVYGPHTTLFFYEADVFNNRKVLRRIDTTLTGFQRYNFLQRLDNQWVDLGNLGTAARRVFYQSPESIGANVGQSVYDLYARQPHQMKYFDTKSPFTNMYFAPGGSGQNILDFDFSRNINPRTNAGFNIRRVTAVKQFGPPTSGEDNLLGIWDVSVGGNYESENKRYTLMGYGQYFQHKENDQGGVIIDGKAPIDTIFRSSLDIARSILGTTVSSNETRRSIHLYHQYKIANGLQLYHVFDIQGRSYRYRDVSAAAHLSFYHPNKTAKIDTLFQLNNYSLIENKAGIKGFYKGYNYRLHLRRRDYTFGDTLQRFSTKNNENFLGIWLNYYFPDSLRRATAEFEYLIGKDYRLKAEYESPKFTAGFTSTLYSPTLLQQRFGSQLVSWDNAFKNTFVNHAYISAERSFGKVTLTPSFSYQLVKNYIYFDTASAPRQTAVPFSIFRLSTGIHWRVGKFETTNQIYLSHITDDSYLRLPKVLINSRLAYDFKYAKVLYIQAGLDLHYRSGYYGDAYNPLVQSFYLNDKFPLASALVADAFAVFRINRVRLFVKMSNVGHGIIQKGYYASPYFPAIYRTFGFGVNWLLFD